MNKPLLIFCGMVLSVVVSASGASQPSEHSSWINSPEVQAAIQQRIQKERAEKARKEQQDRDFWSKNRERAVEQRANYNRCVLEHIGNANSSSAVFAVRSSCQELHWPHEWPVEYLTVTIPSY